MKISKEQLRQIIIEELESISETGRDIPMGPPRGTPDPLTKGMDVDKFFPSSGAGSAQQEISKMLNTVLSLLSDIDDKIAVTKDPRMDAQRNKVIAEICRLYGH